MSDFLFFAAAIVLLAASFYVERNWPLRRRFFVGLIAFIGGAIGIAVMLATSNAAFLQGEATTYGLMSVFGLGVVAGILLLVPVIFTLIKRALPKRQRRERWPPS